MGSIGQESQLVAELEYFIQQLVDQPHLIISFGMERTIVYFIFYIVLLNSSADCFPLLAYDK